MSLYRNINKRKRAGTSRPKSKSTISAKAYRNMKAGFPNSKTNKAKRKAKKRRRRECEKNVLKSKRKSQDLVAIKKELMLLILENLEKDEKENNAIARI